jgi:hypothetical protein
MENEDAVEFCNQVRAAQFEMGIAAAAALRCEWISPLQPKHVHLEGAPADVLFLEQCRFTACNEYLEPTHISLVQEDLSWMVCEFSSIDGARTHVIDVTPTFTARQEGDGLTVGSGLNQYHFYLSNGGATLFLQQLALVTGQSLW